MPKTVSDGGEEDIYMKGSLLQKWWNLTFHAIGLRGSTIIVSLAWSFYFVPFLCVWKTKKRGRDKNLAWGVVSNLAALSPAPPIIQLQLHVDFLSILSESLATSGLTSSPPLTHLNCANNLPIDPQL